MSSHFALFGLQPRFALDMPALEAAYRQLLARVHPDGFARATDADRRAAMQWSVRVNEAYATLKNPEKRAVHLLEERGVALGLEDNTAMEPAFLMQQMEWREAVDDARAARNIDALDRLLGELRSERDARRARLGALIDSGADAPAAEAVRQLIFIARVETEIGESIAMLEDA
ncbi:MAG: Fe-S protein assembly co-chaperone HscB [Burkholderiales bacterium]